MNAWYAFALAGVALATPAAAHDLTRFIDTRHAYYGDCTEALKECAAEWGEGFCRRARPSHDRVISAILAIGQPRTARSCIVVGPGEKESSAATYTKPSREMSTWLITYRYGRPYAYGRCFDQHCGSAGGGVF